MGPSSCLPDGTTLVHDLRARADLRLVEYPAAGDETAALLRDGDKLVVSDDYRSYSCGYPASEFLKFVPSKGFPLAGGPSVTSSLGAPRLLRYASAYADDRRRASPAGWSSE